MRGAPIPISERDGKHMTQSRQLVSWNNVAPMTEAVSVAPSGQVETWDLPTWGPEEEVAVLADLLSALGQLDDDVRKLRAHIGSFAGCDSGVPATVDELLNGIGRGKLAEPAFRNGCNHHGFCVEVYGTQPSQTECMVAIHEILTARLDGKPKGTLVSQRPWASGFIENAYTWMPVYSQMTRLQTLLTERMLLPFEFLTAGSHADSFFDQPCGLQELGDAVMKKCYEDGGRGPEIDAEIEKLEGLPKISMAYPQHTIREEIKEQQKQDLYTLCCSLAHGLHTLCDCHHSTFRWIEKWVYAIGTGQWCIPTREVGAESTRISHLMFGYLLGLDKWLLDVPEQFLLLDLGHIDLGFDLKNEIVRVYAYLGSERTPVKTWLAAYLWTNLMYNNGGLLWRDRHRALLDDAQAKGVSVREWMNRQLG